MEMIRLLEKAVEADPRFAVAWAELARAYIWAHWMSLDKGAVAKAEAAAEKARLIDPDLPKVDIAMGFIQYYGHRNYGRAIEHFEAALTRRPNSIEAIMALGYIKRRQGLWEESLSHFEAAQKIDPRNFHLYLDGLGNCMLNMRRYEEAERFTDRAIAMKPDVILSYLIKAQIIINKDGDVAGARECLRTVIELATPSEICLVLQYVELGPLSRICFGNPCEFPRHEDVEECEKLEHLEDAFNKCIEYICSSDEAAKLKAIQHADSASAEFEKAAPPFRPYFANDLTALGIIFAHLGRDDDAIRMGRLAVETIPISLDAVDGPDLVYGLAAIYAMAGEYQAAIDLLGRILEVPSGVSMRFIDLDPVFAPLRDRPGYTDLRERYSNP
jgi:tetratricopeptide (TPR) repeat protein